MTYFLVRCRLSPYMLVLDLVLLQASFRLHWHSNIRYQGVHRGRLVLLLALSLPPL